MVGCVSDKRDQSGSNSHLNLLVITNDLFTYFGEMYASCDTQTEFMPTLSPSAYDLKHYAALPFVVALLGTDPVA
jgi:hypothetical protein